MPPTGAIPGGGAKNAALGGVFKVIAWVIGMSVAIIICTPIYLINERPYEREPLKPAEPFIVSEYCDRMEKATLDILEHREAVEQTIILWWGLDGLRLNEDGELEWISRKTPKPVNQNEDGELEWISRKTPKPVNQNVPYHPCQSVPAYNPALFAQMQSTRASIDALRAQNASLQIQAQALQVQQTVQVINSLQQYCVQYPAQYPPYFYGGCCGNYVG